MAQISPDTVATKIANFIHAAGLEFHSESKDGESYTRIQAGKTFATTPQGVLQSAGAFLVLNLPGSADQAVAAALSFFGLGNSNPPSTPLQN